MFNHGLVALGFTVLLIGIFGNVLPEIVGTANTDGTSSIGLVAALFCLGLGICSLAISIYIGVNGHKLAWRNRRFEGGISQYLQVQRAWHNWGVGLLLIIPVIAILAAIVLPVFASARENARTASCQNNLKQLSIALIAYVQDYDEVLPQKGVWCDRLYPYIQSRRVYVCPDLPDKSSGYAFNAALSQVRLTFVADPRDIATEFDASGGWNLYGYSDLPDARHAGRNKANIAFLDGHVKSFSLEGMDGVVKWDPLR
jgi:prepilin-type processing-associated H-X9-DG protein